MRSVLIKRCLYDSELFKLSDSVVPIQSDILPTWKTGTNLTTDREQFTRSNTPTARLPTLVRLAETLTRDWLNTNKPREMVMPAIALLCAPRWRPKKSQKNLWLNFAIVTKSYYS